MPGERAVSDRRDDFYGTKAIAACEESARHFADGALDSKER